MRLSNAVINFKPAYDRDGWKIFDAAIDKTWRIGEVPHGGYLLGLIFSTVKKLQQDSRHPDTIHLSAHFLRSTSSELCHIRVRRLRAGKAFANLEAQLLQNETICITAHFICGELLDVTQMSPSNLTLLPPSPWARRVPLCHPSKARVVLNTHKPFHFNDHYRMAMDDTLKEKNERRLLPTVSRNSLDALEWGAWITLTDPEESLEESMVPFIADMMANTVGMLPKEMRPGMSWRPTMVMNIEFKSRIPTNKSLQFSGRSAGIYSQGRFMTEGRHECYDEVWTSPCDIGEDVQEANSDWKDQMVCLAISQQMALTLPMDVNIRKGNARL